MKNDTIYTVFDIRDLDLTRDELEEEDEEEIEEDGLEGKEAEDGLEEEMEEWEFHCENCGYWFARYVIAKDEEDARYKAKHEYGVVLCRRCLLDAIYYEEYGLVSGKATAYQAIVGNLHNKIRDYIKTSIERARAARDVIRLVGDPLEVKGKSWKGKVRAVAGDSSILSFADRDMGFVSAIAMVGGEGIDIKRRWRLEPVMQEEGESYGEFSDRLDFLKEKMMLALAADSANDASLLLVDGPLVPRPKYSGEYILQLRNLISEAEKAGTALVGFVKRPQSSFLEELRETNLIDRAALYMVLEEGQAYPWPPRRRVERGFEVMYTYIMLAPPPSAGVFRVDAPTWMGEDGFFKALRHIVATSEPESPIPTKLSFAEEQARISRWFLRKVYRKVFDREVSEVDSALWALVTLGWEE
jgi:hypothetical protein